MSKTANANYSMMAMLLLYSRTCTYGFMVASASYLVVTDAVILNESGSCFGLIKTDYSAPPGLLSIVASMLLRLTLFVCELI
ncbi:hypothetical protein [uncultured Brevibacillus sp.]|uniref:hypothetical protein n=1 Tax=uncultured Brevibacillus sp. TaxID=169970 RepID=UPI0025935677|nr:hypothetical protein [uncultured Brevibacillus sp.]